MPEEINANWKALDVLFFRAVDHIVIFVLAYTSSPVFVRFAQEFVKFVNKAYLRRSCSREGCAGDAPY